MTNEEIRNLCLENEQELFEKYFGNIVLTEEIGEEYPKELPLKIEAEYRTFLETLWKDYAP